MSNRMYLSPVGMGRVVNAPSARGCWNAAGAAFVSRQSLPSDPIGTCALSITGIHAGSEIHIFDADSNELVGVESASDPQPFTLQRYAPGSRFNTIRIFVASLGYENIDVTYAMTSDSASIPLFQRIDRNYRNPT